MKSISRWANCNRTVAIYCIVSLKIVLAILAFYLGQLLLAAGVLLTETLVYACAVLFGIVVFVYDFTKGSYWRRKTLDLAIIGCALITITTVSNNMLAVRIYTPAVQASFISKVPTARDILESLKYRDKTSLTKAEKKILKKEFYKQVKLLTKAGLQGNSPEANRALLIMLTIIGALSLTYLLAALVCSLSCSGADVAAVLVGVAGIAGIIWGVIAVTKAIKRKHPRSKKAEHNLEPG